jgi:hypothetical protein
MEENYATNLLRSVSAHLYMRNALDLSQQLLGKSYSSLSVPERALVDKAAYDLLAYFYGLLTPEFFQGQQQAAPVGFGTSHPSTPPQPPTTPADQPTSAGAG